MARGSGSRKRRDTVDIANRRLPLPDVVRSVPYLSVDNFRNDYVTRRKDVLREFEDRRDWHPSGAARPARSFRDSRHRIIAARSARQIRSASYAPDWMSNLWNQSPAIVAFRKPDKVLVCVRRQQRKEVLHAYRKTGRGGGRQRRPRWSYYSSISCRRY